MEIGGGEESDLNWIVETYNRNVDVAGFVGLCSCSDVLLIRIGYLRWEEQDVGTGHGRWTTQIDGRFADLAVGRALEVGRAYSPCH